MKNFMKVIACLFASVMLFNFMTQTICMAAENACVLVKGNGDICNRWITISVKTGNNWGRNKITFTQTKGLLNYSGNIVNEKTYGAYTMKVTDHNTKRTTEHYWKYKKNYTLNLKDNTKYTIKLKAYQPATIGDQRFKRSKSTFIQKFFDATLKQNNYSKYNWSWCEAPEWSVKSTKAVEWCYSSN